MPSVAGGLMQVGPNPDAWKEKKMAQVGFWYVAGGKKRPIRFLKIRPVHWF